MSGRCLPVLSGKHPARCKYVLSPGCPHCGDCPGIVQSVPEGGYHRIGGGPVWEVGYLVEPYEVDPALQPLEKPHQGIRVPLVIIEPFEHRIFEADPALACEIILAYKVNDRLDSSR